MKKYQIRAQVEPKHINFFNRIMEGYEYLGVVSTLNAKQGSILIRTTPDLYKEAIDVVEHMPFEVVVLDAISGDETSNAI